MTVGNLVKALNKMDQNRAVLYRDDEYGLTPVLCVYEQEVSEEDFDREIAPKPEIGKIAVILDHAEAFKDD